MRLMSIHLKSQPEDLNMGTEVEPWGLECEPCRFPAAFVVQPRSPYQGLHIGFSEFTIRHDDPCCIMSSEITRVEEPGSSQDHQGSPGTSCEELTFQEIRQPSNYEGMLEAHTTKIGARYTRV